MSCDFIVYNCAPTLRGLKVGNLVSQFYEDKEELLEFIAEQDKKLKERGIRIVLVKLTSKTALIYVYRQRQLARLLSRSGVQEFLSQYGYDDFSTDCCLNHLRGRLMLSDFPHEIGVFLGYPLDDIRSFIDNKGANCPCTGCWKAYNNIDRAEYIFELYRKCTADCCRQYEKGIDILRLTAAG